MLFVGACRFSGRDDQPEWQIQPTGHIIPQYSRLRMLCQDFLSIKIRLYRNYYSDIRHVVGKTRTIIINLFLSLTFLRTSPILARGAKSATELLEIVRVFERTTSMQIFDYEDIQLIPNKCIVRSRKEVDTTVVFGGRTFKLPVVPANMQTIIDEPLAQWLAENDYFYVMHRFNPERRADFVADMHAKGLFASISVGVKPEEFAFIKELAGHKLTPEYITIDIAHGHSQIVIDMIQHIKKYLPDTFVIAGNVGTPEGVREFEKAGADATKDGIGPGKV